MTCAFFFFSLYDCEFDLKLTCKCYNHRIEFIFFWNHLFYNGFSFSPFVMCHCTHSSFFFMPLVDFVVVLVISHVVVFFPHVSSLLVCTMCHSFFLNSRVIVVSLFMCNYCKSPYSSR